MFTVRDFLKSSVDVELAIKSTCLKHQERDSNLLVSSTWCRLRPGPASRFTEGRNASVVAEAGRSLVKQFPSDSVLGRSSRFAAGLRWGRWLPGQVSCFVTRDRASARRSGVWTLQPHTDHGKLCFVTVAFVPFCTLLRTGFPGVTAEGRLPGRGEPGWQPTRPGCL